MQARCLATAELITLKPVSPYLSYPLKVARVAGCCICSLCFVSQSSLLAVFVTCDISPRVGQQSLQLFPQFRPHKSNSRFARMGNDSRFFFEFGHGYCHGYWQNLTDIDSLWQKVTETELTASGATCPSLTEIDRDWLLFAEICRH